MLWGWTTKWVRRRLVGSTTTSATSPKGPSVQCTGLPSSNRTNYLRFPKLDQANISVILASEDLVHLPWAAGRAEGSFRRSIAPGPSWPRRIEVSTEALELANRRGSPGCSSPPEGGSDGIVTVT